MKKTISFNYNAELRARFLRFKAFQFDLKTDEDLITLALHYAEKLDAKISSKYNTFELISKRKMEGVVI